MLETLKGSDKSKIDRIKFEASPTKILTVKNEYCEVYYDKAAGSTFKVVEGYIVPIDLKERNMWKNREKDRNGYSVEVVKDDKGTIVDYVISKNTGKTAAAANTPSTAANTAPTAPAANLTAAAAQQVLNAQAAGANAPADPYAALSETRKLDGGKRKKPKSTRLGKCAVCGEEYPDEELMLFGNRNFCKNCVQDAIKEKMTGFPVDPVEKAKHDIATASELYCTYSSATGYPFIGEDDCINVCSVSRAAEFTDDATTVEVIEDKGEFFDDLKRFGMNKIIVNNDRDHVFAPEDFDEHVKTDGVTASKLYFEVVNYRQKDDDKIRENIPRTFLESKLYTLSLKDETTEITEENLKDFKPITISDGEAKICPVFTGVTEAKKINLPFDGLYIIDAALLPNDGTTRYMINPASLHFTVNRKTLDAIKEKKAAEKKSEETSATQTAAEPVKAEPAPTAQPVAAPVKAEPAPAAQVKKEPIKAQPVPVPAPIAPAKAQPTPIPTPTAPANAQPVKAPFTPPRAAQNAHVPPMNQTAPTVNKQSVNAPAEPAKTSARRTKPTPISAKEFSPDSTTARQSAKRATPPVPTASAAAQNTQNAAPAPQSNGSEYISNIMQELAVDNADSNELDLSGLFMNTSGELPTDEPKKVEKPAETVQEHIENINTLLAERGRTADFSVINDLNRQIDAKLTELAKMIAQSSVFYAQFDAHTKHIFIDGNNRGHIFSDKAIAEKSNALYPLKGVDVFTKEYKNIDIFSMIFEFKRHGIQDLVVDETANWVIISTDLILDAVDSDNREPMNITVMNPELMFSMAQLFQKRQLKSDYPNRKNEIASLERRMIREFSSAKYILPLLVDEKGTTHPFMISDNKKGIINKILVFSDISEMKRFFGDKIGIVKDYKILSYRDMAAQFNESRSTMAVLNEGSLRFEFNHQNCEIINKVIGL